MSSFGPPPLPQPRNRRLLPLLVVGGVLVVVVIVAALAVTIAWFSAPTLAPRVDPSAEERRTEIVQALATPSVELDPAEVPQIQSTLLKIGQAIKNDDIAGMGLVDLDRMLAELDRLPSAQRLKSKDRRDFKTGVEQGIRKWFNGQAQMESWDEVRIRTVRPVPDAPGDVVVYARLKSDDVWLTMRFWMHKTDAWRMYDFEDLDVGLRTSSLMGELLFYLMAQDQTKARQSLQYVNEFSVIMAAWRGEDHERVVSLTGSVGSWTLPPSIVAIGHTVRGGSLLALGKYDESAAALTQAETLMPESPLVLMLYSSLSIAREDYKRGIEYSRRYEANVGVTGLSSWTRATGHLALEQQDEALAAIREGLDEEPEEPDLLEMLADMDRADAKAEFAARIKAAKLTREGARQLLNTFDRSDQTEVMEVILQAQAAVLDGTIDARFFHAATLDQRRQYEAAAAEYLKDIDTQEAFFAPAILSRYLAAMANAGKPIEGYNRVRRKNEAFDYLINEYVIDDAKVARELIDLHLKRYDTDAVAWKALGAHHIEQEQCDDAVASFDRALDVNRDPEATENIRWRRMYALHQLGRSIESFEKEDAGTPTRFGQLASLLQGEKRFDDLAKVIALHKAAVPKSDSLPRWEAELAFARGEYRRVIEILTPVTPSEEDYGFQYARTDKLVRSHYRLGDLETARKINDGYLILPDLVLTAASGDVGATEKAIQAAIDDEEYSPQDLLDDPDLAPLLRRPAFAQLRGKLQTLANPPVESPDTRPSDAD